MTQDSPRRRRGRGVRIDEKIFLAAPIRTYGVTQYSCLRRLLLILAVCLLVGAIQTPPAGKWKDLNIIDVHTHTGSFRGFDIGPDILTQNLQQYGIAMALVSNIDGADIPATRNLNELEANEATADLVRKHPELMRGLLWARPNDGSADNLARFLNGPDQGLFVGIKFHPEFNHFQADDPHVDPYMKLCERYGIAAVFHCGREGSSSSPAAIYALARRHPAVPVVLYHSGFYTDHAAAIDAVKESMLKHNARLYLETAQVRPADVLRMISEVGADHVLFGTDATYFGADHYAAYEDMIDRLKETLTATDFRKVVSENARIIFNTDEHR